MVHHYSMIAIGDSGRGFCLSLRSLFPCAFDPHPPDPLLPQGFKGGQMPETGDGTQGRAKNLPL